MKKYLLLLTLFISSLLFSQQIKESELIGVWKVITVESTSPVKADQKKMFDLIISAFKKSSFDFKSNNNFILHINFQDFGEKLNNVHWQYNPKNSIITIQSWNAKEMFMKILVEKKNGKVYFSLSETPLLLEVKK